MNVSDPKTEATRLAWRPREAARALGVSERTLAKWTQQGIIPHIRRKKTILYPVDVLRRWLNDQAKAKALKRAGRPVGGDGAEQANATATPAEGAQDAHDGAAIAWLRELLKAGPMDVAKIKDEGKAAGYAWRTVRRAKDELGIRTYRERENWTWKLPDGPGATAVPAGPAALSCHAPLTETPAAQGREQGEL